MMKKIIYGCESRGDANSPYLTRYTLCKTRWFQLCIHVFHRSDADHLHDHPWNFWTLVLRHGYRERYATTPGLSYATKLRRLKPGRLYYRAAEHTHRVILDLQESATAAPYYPRYKEAVTLVLMLRRRREWGFFVKGTWQRWTEYFTKMGC